LTDERSIIIPFAHTKYKNNTKEEISVSAIFDDTTRLGETFSIMLCFVLEGKIVQGLVNFEQWMLSQ